MLSPERCSSQDFIYGLIAASVSIDEIDEGCR